MRSTTSIFSSARSLLLVFSMVSFSTPLNVLGSSRGNARTTTVLVNVKPGQPNGGGAVEM